MKRPALSMIYILLLSLLGVLLMATNKSNGFLSTSVSTISGTVSNLDHELLEYVNTEKPTHDHSSVYYKRFFVSKFNLGDKAISASFSKPITIADGDQLTVSGYMKNDVFQVLAYSNQTQQASHHENWIILILGALFFAAVALGLLNSQLLLDGAIVPKLFLFGFTLVAIYMVYRALLVREAIKLLSN